MRPSGVVLLAFAFSGGCAQVIGLDDFTDQPSGGTGTGSSSASSTMSTGSSGVGGSGGDATGGNGGGGGVPAQCSPGNVVTDIVSDPNLRARELQIIPAAPGGNPMLVTAVGGAFDGSMAKMTVASVSGGSPTVQSWTFSNGDVDVFGLTQVDETQLAALVRAGNDQLGVVTIPLDNGGVLPLPAGLSMAFAVPSPCRLQGGFIKRAVVQEPVDLVNPRIALLCHDALATQDRLYEGPPGSFMEIGSGMGDHLNPEAYYRVGTRGLLITGDNPATGSFFRVFPGGGAPQQIIVDPDPMLWNVFIAGIPDEGASSVRLFFATIQAGSFVPATMFQRAFTESELSALGTAPVPSTVEVASLTVLEELAAFRSLTRASNGLFAAGPNITEDAVRFSWFRDDTGEPLIFGLEVYSAMGGTTVTSAATAVIQQPGVIVAWFEEELGMRHVRFKTVTCVGGT
jgi:hypothetical protein